MWTEIFRSVVEFFFGSEPAAYIAVEDVNYPLAHVGANEEPPARRLRLILRTSAVRLTIELSIVLFPVSHSKCQNNCCLTVYFAVLQRSRIMESSKEVSSVLSMLDPGHVSRPDLLQARLHLFQALDLLNLGINVVPPPVQDNNNVMQGE